MDAIAVQQFIYKWQKDKSKTLIRMVVKDKIKKIHKLGSEARTMNMEPESNTQAL